MNKILKVYTQIINDYQEIIKQLRLQNKKLSNDYKEALSEILDLQSLVKQLQEELDGIKKW